MLGRLATPGANVSHGPSARIVSVVDWSKFAAEWVELDPWPQATASAAIAATARRMRIEMDLLIGWTHAIDTHVKVKAPMHASRQVPECPPGALAPDEPT